MNSLAKIAQSLVGGAALSAGGWGATAPFIAGFSTATRLGKVPLKAGLGLAGQGVMQAGKLAAKGVGKAAGMGAYGIGAATNAVKGSGSSSGVSSLKGGLSRAASGIAGWWNGVLLRVHPDRRLLRWEQTPRVRALPPEARECPVQ